VEAGDPRMQQLDLARADGAIPGRERHADPHGGRHGDEPVVIFGESCEFR
jgi:hypothetical protein